MSCEEDVIAGSFAPETGSAHHLVLMSPCLWCAAIAVARSQGPVAPHLSFHLERSHSVQCQVLFFNPNGSSLITGRSRLE